MSSERAALAVAALYVELAAEILADHGITGAAQHLYAHATDLRNARDAARILAGAGDDD